MPRGYRDYWVASDVLEFTSHGYDGYLFDDQMNKVEFEGYRTDRVTDFALDFIEKGSKEEKPFFLMLSHIEPHHQNDRDQYEGPEGSKERFKDYQVPRDLQDTEGDWRENYPDYLGCCNSLDNNLGRIMDKLEELGIADNTVVIYTSDHGSHFRTRNGEYKRSCHEASIRIPMIAYGPGFTGGQEISELVSLLDVPSTIMSAAGVDDPASDVYVEDFLYDLENDPYEKNNLAEDAGYEDIREDLASRLKRAMESAGEETPTILPYGSEVE